MTALLDVDQLRTFIAIAETGSFTRAADIVHKTQSAVSMQMKRLEERLDRAIFARDGRASKLTEDGERLLDYARRIVKLNVETIAAFSDELTGRVRLGVPDDYADRYLPEIMARFSRAYPAVELTVICEETICLLERIKAQRDRSRDHHQLLRQHDGGEFPPGAPAVGDLEPAFDPPGRAPAARARPADLRVAPRRDRVPGDDRAALSRALFERQCERDQRRGAVRACGVGVSGIGLRPGMRVLSAADGFPELPSCRIGLVRNPHERSDGRRARRARHLVARQPVGGGTGGGVTSASAAAVASSTRTDRRRKLDLQSAPPPLTMTSHARARCATNTRTRFFCPNGEMPPT